MKSASSGLLDSPVYVISLPRSAARRRWIVEHLREKGVCFEFVDAVDGQELAEEPGPLTRGERACYLSHLAVWKRLLDGNARGAFVFEDDVMMLPWCSVSVLGEVARQTRPGEVVLLQSSARYLWKRCRRLLSEGRSVIAYTLDDTKLASAYYLTREGAAAMVERWRREGIRFCVDHWYSKRGEYPSWRGTLPILVLQPNAFVQREEFVSEIARLGRGGLSGAEFQCCCSPVLFDGRWRHVPRDSLRFVRRQLGAWLQRPARIS